MASPYPRSTAAIAGHPVHAALVPFPIVCFVLTLLTDLAYWRTANLMWQNFSSWLLFAGLVGGGLAAVAGAIDLLSRAEVRAQKPAWPHAVGNLVVLCLAFLNSLVHARDGWTGVVPWGIVLSVLTVLLLTVTVWLGRAMVFRHGVGVRAS
ncbi:DUF2231 domain-containing protein [Parvularcula dongshanensis]|uniref:Putative membrane protein n=1 Tax=Parvularcula dongshanensis TaxID=1173995 RepID=A0A840I010_9PROT|nr:DUF2231 domain-containing protein [Parvularcula dongshanensis]MBB4657594.1 putative membrane protein [Parvularcula dongshanensis]